MPLPLIFMGVAAATGIFGVSKTAKAVVDSSTANKVNLKANKEVEDAVAKFNLQKENADEALNNLGALKIKVLSTNVNAFINTFERIKNINMIDSEGLNELRSFNDERHEFEELKQMGNLAIEVAGGATAGVASGALAAFGAYNAAMTFGAASTGTAISTLSGAAASNATLAFFGGGSLASGGLGMAGGTLVLGGLVAGPALLVMGLMVDAKAQEKVDNALANADQAKEIVETVNVSTLKCSAIRRRANMFYNVLTNLDSDFLKLVWDMEDVVNNEGEDFRNYSAESKQKVALAATKAKSIKALIDTPILTDQGDITDASAKLAEQYNIKVQ